MNSDRTDEPVAYENYIATGPSGSGAVRDVYTDRMGSIVMIVDPATVKRMESGAAKLGSQDGA